MQEVEEAASDIAASAKAGLEKTKAVVEEKIETMRTSDPVKIREAEVKKHARINEAERRKQNAMAQNEASKHHGEGCAPAGNTSAHDSDAHGNTPDGPASGQCPTRVTEKV